MKWFKLAAFAAFPLTAATQAVAQLTPAEKAMDEAWIAWEMGEYPKALEGFIRLLEGPSSAQFQERIALLTGELYHTYELTADGANPLVSPNGRYVSYESGSERQTTIVDVRNGMRVVANISGTSLTFSPRGDKVAYLAVRDVPAVRNARAALASATDENRGERNQALRWTETQNTVVRVRDLATGGETDINDGGLIKDEIVYNHDGSAIYALAGKDGDAMRNDIYALSESAAPRVITDFDGFKSLPSVPPSGTHLLYVLPFINSVPQAPTPGAAGGRGAGRGGRGAGGGGGGRGGGGGGGRGGARGPGGFSGGAASFALHDLRTNEVRTLTGLSPSISANGERIVWVERVGTENKIVSMATAGGEPVDVKVVDGRLDSPALSPNGRRVAFQYTPREDWEIYLIDVDGNNEVRLTREIQHDLQPQFLTNDRLLAVMGEARHRRSYLYDVNTLERKRLFHNNTVRTIAPEYSWTPSADGSMVVIVAERDGDTVSDERGVYATDLTRMVTRDELLARLRAGLEGENDLRARGARMFAPISETVRDITSKVSIAKIFSYEKSLFDFDSKNITRPGNKPAREYLFDTYRSFGYQPELQWFERAQAVDSGRTANVLATLPGTENPELIYVVSSHFDSHASGPGADDNTSGTAALLEAARVLRDHPQPATIIFASFTGEESGLLGSREFVRQAVASNMKLVGALNNDMLGWSNDHRLDNTIRYSNKGIRDIQHSAAFLFTDLITYDALYYKSTDAAAYYEEYGDIVGGIGSYPVLGNPHYHTSHDILEVENHRLITEVSKTTVATLIMLASSPSRLANVAASRSGSGVQVSWTASPEKSVTGYIVEYSAANGQRTRVSVTEPRATLPTLAAGSEIAVKAVNARGLEGWDWARVILR